MSSPLWQPILLPDSSASTAAAASSPRKTRVPYAIDFTAKPSDQEISDYTLIGGNLL
ncbi:unnamed protein product [Arabis nemorensis]|uniref:Uncharacterized protein n=1 Tax=Arabis nemorensis TaxID=586526 RepID=A0A565BGL5_9BRAS|nr:unnamed protein product [Arabis nemorensis]